MLRLPSLPLTVALLAACGPTPATTDTAATESPPATTSSTTPGDPMNTSTSTSTSTTAEPTTSGSGGSTEPTTTSATTAVTTSTATTTESTASSGSTTESVDSSSSGSSTDGTTTGVPAVCEAPVDCLPVFFDDVNGKVTDEASGWVICNGGTVHYRQEVKDCAHEVFWPACSGQPGECSVDADCPGNLACADIYGTCECTEQCMSDSECGPGRICLCAGGGNGGWLALKNWCVPAGCTGPDDCDGECGCRGAPFFCGTLEGAQCPTLMDECHDNADCGNDGCFWDPQQARWRCQPWGNCE